jgi:two-component system, NarL family, nitrate/nitrite response regulator NarL
MTTQRTRVALVEDHVLLAQTLCLALEAESFDPVIVPIPQETTQASGLLDAILQSSPAVLLLDLDLGHVVGDALPLIAPVAAAGIPVCVVTGSSDQTRWGECLANGARAVLSKSSPLEEIVDTVKHTLAGRQVMTEAQRYELIQRWYRHRSGKQDARARIDSLSPREAHVLASLVQGKRVREIASDAFVSEATVRTQVKSILAKLGVSSQIAAVAMAKDLNRGGAA